MRINVGCGQTPTPGWNNFDNSPSVRLAQLPPLLVQWLVRLSLINRGQHDFITFCRSRHILHANALALPLADGQVAVLYSCHMLEHLDHRAAVLFLREARRLLKPGGIIRLVVPDLEKMVLDYTRHRDGNAFLEQTLLLCADPRTFREKAAFLLSGHRGHKYLYDAQSLCRLLTEEGFVDPRPLPPGITTIPDPGQLNLHERAEESLFVEATAPAS